MLCKHFNLSWLEIRNDLSLAEYICLLADSLDAEELDDYNRVVSTAISFHDPKRVKRWKWSSPDKAGTSPTSSVAASIVGFAALAKGGQFKPSGSYLSYIQATGRPVGFRTIEGDLVDEDGNLVERTVEIEGDVLDKDGNLVKVLVHRIIIPYTKQEM